MPTEETEPLIALADEIVAELDAHVWSQELTAERTYYPTITLKQLSKPHVYIVPLTIDEENGGRGNVLEDMTLNLSLQAKLNYEASKDESRDELDGWLRFSREIKEHFQRLNFRLPSGALMHWLRGKTLTTWSRSQLESNDVFTSVLELTYKQIRS